MVPLSSLPATSAAVTYGKGLFTTLYSSNGQIHYWPEHWQRLSQSAQALAVPLPTEPSLQAALAPLLIAAPQALRISLYPEGFHIQARPAPLARHHPLQLTLISAKRGDSPLLRHKTTNYWDNHYWLNQLNAQGYDDGLFCHYRDHIQESPRANVFFIHGKRLLTPPLEDGLLPGIMRHQVLQLAQQQNWPIHIASIPCSALAQMDAAFLTNSIRHIQPIGRIDNYHYCPHHPWIDYLQRQLNPPC